MRVIAGSARSLQLKTPKGENTRPTTDRIKETLFNMIQLEVPGARFLDVFAGSGGIGIEALSRGAKEAVFIEKDKEALSCITDNIKHTKFTDRARVLKQDCFVAFTALEFHGTFDVVFLDPPYHMELERRVLEYLTTSSLIDADSLIIFEAALDTDLAFLDALPYRLERIKKYKTNMHVFVRKNQEEIEDKKEKS